MCYRSGQHRAPGSQRKGVKAVRPSDFTLENLFLSVRSVRFQAEMCGGKFEQASK